MGRGQPIPPPPKRTSVCELFHRYPRLPITSPSLASENCQPERRERCRCPPPPPRSPRVGFSGPKRPGSVIANFASVRHTDLTKVPPKPCRETPCSGDFPKRPMLPRPSGLGRPRPWSSFGPGAEDPSRPRPPHKASKSTLPSTLRLGAWGGGGLGSALRSVVRPGAARSAEPRPSDTSLPNGRSALDGLIDTRQLWLLLLLLFCGKPFPNGRPDLDHTCYCFKGHSFLIGFLAESGAGYQLSAKSGRGAPISERISGRRPYSDLGRSPETPDRPPQDRAQR